MRTLPMLVAPERGASSATFHVWPGAHEGQYWDGHFADYLDFYADACS